MKFMHVISLIIVLSIHSSIFGLFIVPGEKEDTPKRVQKTGAQLTIGKNGLQKNGSEFDNPWVNNVINNFDRIAQKASAELVAYDTHNTIPGEYYADQAKVVTQTIGEVLNIKDRIEGYSHFQSIKRVPKTTIVYLDGGSAITKNAHLFILDMKSEPPMGPWVSNTHDKTAKQRDTIVKTITLYEGITHWHPGGMDICGKYLVIPLEGPTGTQVTFYDISDPLNPKKLNAHINIAGGCMANALARLPDDHYLAGAMMNSISLDLYYSKTTQLEDGFFDTPTVLDVPRETSRTNYQNINFITQTDGTLFMIGTQNTKQTSPIISGQDYMDLFIIEYDIVKFANINKLIEQGKNIESKDLAAYARCLRQKDIHCEDRCNFNAGGTIFIKDQSSLAIYATPHWPHDKKTMFNIYE